MFKISGSDAEQRIAQGVHAYWVRNLQIIEFGRFELLDYGGFVPVEVEALGAHRERPNRTKNDWAED